MLRPRDDFYTSEHPKAEDVLLVIEIADSSLPCDREQKLPLYARFSIPEAWLMDIPGRAIRCIGPRNTAPTPPASNSPHPTG